ncbi:hypothetical protein C8F04DRAFT_1023838 [Mycena alexandri]|uniref:Uncharacterized protein n=1 Tax=Mycena alexandri TaxID=1745969 RepID=A0AAD6THU5_9AGAR|nr:hypothetical protein C8F04DRAFT_1023838 [Mycena alexandri]
MAPARKYTRSRRSELLAPRSPTPSLPLHPNRIARNRKSTPTPTPLTREQIDYLVAKASEKTQQQKDDHEAWTAVPNPIPDTGIHPTAVYRVKPLSSVSSSPSVPSSPNVSPSQSFSTAASPLPFLPPVLTLASTKPTTTPALLAPTTTAKNQNVSAPSPPHRLPTPAVVSLIAIAGTCLLLALFILMKLCRRPTPRPRPVPSRPILDDPFPEDDSFQTKLEDSPVFGGKERLSERPGNSGLWAWTQYPTPATTTVAPSTDSTAPLARSGTQGKMSYAGRNEKSNHFTDTPHVPLSTQTPANSPYPAPMQQVQTALARAANRISTASASMYPGTPSSNQNYGLVTSFTADGYPVMERVNPKVLQRSRSSTLGERNHRERPQSRVNRYSTGFAYDGAEVASPPLTVRSPTTPAVPMMPGRTRIKSSYYALPRTSTMPPSQSTKANLRENAHQKSESRTERDPRGVASALGFGSPATVYPTSPQPTLYPDDSLSMVEAKRLQKPVLKKPVPSNRTSRVFGRGDEQGLVPASPTVDATAALGNLMLMDFGAAGESAMSLNLASASSATIAPKRMTRSDDKPPRVPSPPPLPSLTQMALEHANPEAYADYRSPTYSIYGLYEADRKSRAGS